MSGVDHDPSIFLEKRGEFLRFVEARVGSREDAEDLLQEAYLKGIKNDPAELENSVAWFYRVLRNSVVDLYRRRGSAGRAHQLYRFEHTTTTEIDAGLYRTTCLCVETVIDTLRPSYRTILRQVDLEENSLSDVAASLGIDANNGRVRLHRARRALREALLETCGLCAEHGCLDCDCRRN